MAVEGNLLRQKFGSYLVKVVGVSVGNQVRVNIEQFSYTVDPDGSTLTATVTSVTVTDTQGTDRSAEQPPFHDVGYQFTLQLQAPGLLLETPLGAGSTEPGYWCQDGVAPEDAAYCGQ